MALATQNMKWIQSRQKNLFYVLGFCTAVIYTVLLRMNCRCSTSGTALEQDELDKIKLAYGPEPESIAYGNALTDGKDHSGWFVGHFMNPGSLQRSENVEVKFTFNPTGSSNEAVTANHMSRSLSILVSGRHRLLFGNTSILLENVGDYAMWGRGVSHTWKAELDSTIVTVRWPSIRGDQYVHEDVGKEKLRNVNSPKPQL